METNFDIRERLDFAASKMTHTEKLNDILDIVNSLLASREYENNFEIISRLANEISKFANNNNTLNKKEMNRLKDNINSIIYNFNRKKISSNELRVKMDECMVKYVKSIKFMLYDIDDLYEHKNEKRKSNINVILFVIFSALALIIIVIINFIRLDSY